MTEEPVSLMSIYAGSFMPLRPPPSLPLHPKPSMVDRPEGARLGPRPDGVSIVQILPKARWRAVVIGQSEAHPPEQTRSPPGKGKVMQSSHSQQQVLSILPGMDELQPTPAPADASHPPRPGRQSRHGPLCLLDNQKRETHPDWALFAQPRNRVSCCRRAAPVQPVAFVSPTAPHQLEAHVGGLDTYLGPAVGLFGVQQMTAQAQADGKRCNPTAESRRGAPQPDGPLPVTARRKQPHPIPAMASNASLDGARSTVSRYSAMAAWHTSPRRDAAIERELDRRSGGHDSAPARRRCRFGNRPRRSRPVRGGPRRQRIPLSGGELTEAQTWRAGLQEPCRGGGGGGARVLPVDEEETMSAFCRKLAVAEHWRPTAGVLCRITGGHDTGQADFAVRLEANRGIENAQSLVPPAGTPNSGVPRWIHDPGLWWRRNAVASVQEHAVSAVKTARHNWSRGWFPVLPGHVSIRPSSGGHLNRGHGMRRAEFNQRMDIGQPQMKRSASHRGTVSSTRRNHPEPLFASGAM